MHSISKKVRWIVAVLSINLITIIFVNIWLNNSQKFDAKVINIAGKQRMLSQRTVLELHRLLVGEENSYIKLQKARQEFDANFKKLSATSSEFHTFKNDEIEMTLLNVYTHWNKMNGLIDLYLAGNHDLNDLKIIYENGEKTLLLMDKAVSQYELDMMNKHLWGYRLQILLAIISFGVILYMGRVTLLIQDNFHKFLEHSKSISGAADVHTQEGNELDVACAHIGHFLKDVEEALQHAANIVAKSENRSANLIGLAPETDHILEQSEDMMIQVSEELTLSVNRLKKLQENLRNANLIHSS